MKVKDIMTREVVFVGMDDTLGHIKDIFDLKQFHHVMVMGDDEALVGVISDRDVLRRLSPFVDTANEEARDTRTLEKKAHQIMTRKPIVAEMDMSIEDAARLLLKEKISCIPVLGADGAVLGVVTWKDLLKNFPSNFKD